MDLSATSGSSTQKKVNELAQNVKLELQDGVNIFRVSYQNSDPAVAKRVVQSLLTIFVESNLGVNRKELAGARRFIDNQLKEYERQLQEAEKRRADFQRNNIGYLPGDQNYLQQLETAKTNLRQSESDLKDAKVQLSEMKKYMSGLSPRLEVTNPSASRTADRWWYCDEHGKHDDSARIATLQANIDDLKSRYTANHPDVVVAQRQLDELLAQVKSPSRRSDATNGQGDNSDLAANATASNPVYEQMLVKVIDQESKIAVLKGRALDQRRRSQSSNEGQDGSGRRGRDVSSGS